MQPFQIQWLSTPDGQIIMHLVVLGVTHYQVPFDALGVERMMSEMQRELTKSKAEAAIRRDPKGLIATPFNGR